MFFFSGWLGIALFFTPIAFTILVDIFFYLSTTQVINRMSTYGRIHHKMKFRYYNIYVYFIKKQGASPIHT